MVWERDPPMRAVRDALETGSPSGGQPRLRVRPAGRECALGWRSRCGLRGTKDLRPPTSRVLVMTSHSTKGRAAWPPRAPCFRHPYGLLAGRPQLPRSVTLLEMEDAHAVKT
jgi:hypothetical protein